MSARREQFYKWFIHATTAHYPPPIHSSHPISTQFFPQSILQYPHPQFESSPRPHNRHSPYPRTPSNSQPHLAQAYQNLAQIPARAHLITPQYIQFAFMPDPPKYNLTRTHTHMHGTSEFEISHGGGGDISASYPLTCVLAPIALGAREREKLTVIHCRGAAVKDVGLRREICIRPRRRR